VIEQYPTIVRLSLGKIDADLAANIDILCNDCGGTVFHEVALNRMASAAFGSDLSYYLAYQDAELVGCCPCHSFREGWITRSYSNLSANEMPYGGWVFDENAVSLEGLLAKTRTHALESLSIVSNIALQQAVKTAWEKLGAKSHETVLVGLEGQTEEEIFNSLKHSQKQKIRRALKLGLEAVSLDPGDFGVFTALGTDLKRKAGLKIRDEAFYKGVFSHYHALGRAVCTAVRYQGEYISTGIALANSNYAIGWAAGRKIGIPNNLYQNELLIWDQIRWAKNLGCAYLDLGAIHPDRLPHLLRMKLSFSRETKKFYSYSIRKLPFRLAHFARRLCK